MDLDIPLDSVPDPSLGLPDPDICLFFTDPDPIGINKQKIKKNLDFYICLTY